MGNTRPQKRGGLLEPDERGDQGAEEREYVVGTPVREFGLRPAPHAFVGIELGGIGREVRDAKARVRRQEFPDHGAAVDVAVVPHDEDGAAEVAEQMPEKRARVRGTQVLTMQLEIEAAAPPPATERESGDDGDAVVQLPMPEDGGLPARCPGPADGRDQEEARLVDEDQVGAQPRGVFFSRGHVRRFHLAMAASSRWSARRSGFCGVHPN